MLTALGYAGDPTKWELGPILMPQGHKIKLIEVSPFVRHHRTGLIGVSMVYPMTHNVLGTEITLIRCIVSPLAVILRRDSSKLVDFLPRINSQYTWQLCS